jgi:outer membrane protein OmpA-like peptidoglycan-associated protein
MIAVFTLMQVLFPGMVLAQDCDLGKRYYDQARSESDPAKKVELFRKSLEACPTFNGWYLLGYALQDRGRTQEALEAYNSAMDMAGNDKARALAQGRIGQVMAAKGETMEAVTRLREALRLHPQPPGWIGDTLRDLEIKQSASVVPARDISDALRSRGFSVRPSVHLRIHFAYDRADLTAQGTRQVEELGKALTEPKMKNRRFLIVGHTDSRGSADYNQVLSEKRARTVKQELEGRFSSLAGRLSTEGRGKTQLLYPGTTEEDHRLNRRVEVKVRGE